MYEGAEEKPSSLAGHGRPACDRHYRAIFDSALDFAIIATDCQGRISDWNPGAENILGWSAKEACGQSLDLFFTAEDQANGRARIEMARALQSGRASDERWHVRKDGSPFWASGEMMPLRAETGAHLGFLKILRDCTASKQAEAESRASADALEASERRLRLAIDAGRLAVWEFDIGREELIGSPDLNRLLGFPPEYVVGFEQVWAGYLPGERERLTRSGQAAIAKGQSFFEEDFQYRRPDGVKRWLQMRAEILFGPDGKPVRVVGVLLDITDRKMSENALLRSNENLQRRTADADANRTRAEMVARESEASFRMLVDSVVDYAIYMLDPTGNVANWNAGAQRIKGYASEEIIGQHYSRFYTEEARIAGHPERSLRAAQEAGRYEEEGLRVRKDGTQFWASVVIDPIRADDGALLGFAKVTRDITDRRRVQQALEETREALFQSQKMDAIGQLTGGIAHDFNNLLAGIIGSLDLLRRRVDQGRFSEAAKYLDAATTSANRAAALTARLLAFGRRQSLDTRPTDINALLGGMEELLTRTLGSEVALQLVPKSGLWTAVTDSNQFESALLNMAINARDAMPDGGELTIETDNTRLDEAYTRQFEGLAAGDYVALCVSDNGIGMPPDVVEKAFDPFFTTKPIGQGTGLGLSMIYGFAKQAGGHVRIYSEVGQGTSVKLYMPRYAGAPKLVEPAPALTAPRGLGERVLVIEDEPAIRMLMMETLSELGYQAEEAHDGKSAMPRVEDGQRLDLLITDVGLPGGMNGRQVAELARQRRPELRVLFVTGYAQGAAVRAGFLEPGMEMITKPFALDALATKIREMIES